jgi:hypothetical protein
LRPRGQHGLDGLASGGDPERYAEAKEIARVTGEIPPLRCAAIEPTATATDGVARRGRVLKLLREGS